MCVNIPIISQNIVKFGLIIKVRSDDPALIAKLSHMIWLLRAGISIKTYSMTYIIFH